MHREWSRLVGETRRISTLDWNLVQHQQPPLKGNKLLADSRTVPAGSVESLFAISYTCRLSHQSFAIQSRSLRRHQKAWVEPPAAETATVTLSSSLDIFSSYRLLCSSCSPKPLACRDCQIHRAA